VGLAGPDTAAEANRATGGAPVPLALDGVSGDATATLLDIVGWEAKIVCYAAPTREPIKVNPLVLVAKRASIHPFFMYYPEYLPKIPEKIRSAAELAAYALALTLQCRTTEAIGNRGPPFHVARTAS
jgi:NADPH:quinone reductase-like Zn-dependent oxidoreductase